MSVTYIGPKSRTERPRKTKIGTEVAHVTRDSDTTFKVKRSKVNLQGRGHVVDCRDTTAGTSSRSDVEDRSRRLGSHVGDAGETRSEGRLCSPPLIGIYHEGAVCPQ